MSTSSALAETVGSNTKVAPEPPEAAAGSLSTTQTGKGAGDVESWRLRAIREDVALLDKMIFRLIYLKYEEGYQESGVIISLKVLSAANQCASILLAHVRASVGPSEQPSQIDAEVQGLLTGLNDYLTSIGVISTLLFSMTMPVLVTQLEQSEVVVNQAYWVFDEELHEEWLPRLNIIFFILMCISTWGSAVAVLSSFTTHQMINRVMPSAREQLWFLCTQNILIPEVATVVAVGAVLFGIPFGAMVVYGTACGLSAAVTEIVGLLGWGIFQIRTYAQTQKHLRHKYEDLGWKIELELRKLEDQEPRIRRDKVNDLSSEKA